MEKNLFAIASRQRYRFETNKGFLSTEDLWELSLTALDVIARGVNRKIKESTEESFISNTKSKNTELENKLEILKHIIEVKINEKDAAKARAEKSQRLFRLKEIAAQKSDEALSETSLDKIKDMIKELEESE